jgi:hypothetical protein
VFRPEYVVENSVGEQLATTRHTFTGRKSTIETSARRLQCNPKVWSGQLIVNDTATDRTIAVYSKRAIELGDGCGTLHCQIDNRGYMGLKAARLRATTTVSAAAGTPIVTVKWIEANQIVRPFALGEARIGECELDDDTLIVVACLAFGIHARSTVTGG